MRPHRSGGGCLDILATRPPSWILQTLTIETLTYDRVAKTIDHSLLRPELTLDEIREGCELAARYDVASVCARPADVELGRSILAGTRVAVGTVIGFPHGASLTATKVFEAERAMGDGATELDMVINIGWLRSGPTIGSRRTSARSSRPPSRAAPS